MLVLTDVDHWKALREDHSDLPKNMKTLVSLSLLLVRFVADIAQSTEEVYECKSLINGLVFAAH